MKEYDFRAARNEIIRTTRIYRALKAKGELTPEVGNGLKYRVFQLEQEIAEAREQQKMTAGEGSHFVGQAIFTTSIIPEMAGVNKV